LEESPEKLGLSFFYSEKMYYLCIMKEETIILADVLIAQLQKGEITFYDFVVILFNNETKNMDLIEYCNYLENLHKIETDGKTKD
jgi:hypothetical protein